MQLKKNELEQLKLKSCETIREMDDSLIELSYVLHRAVIYVDENILEIKKIYKYFDKNEYNKCYANLSEIKRNIQIIRRKIELLEDKIDNCTLPDTAPCFYFKQYLDEIMHDSIVLKDQYYNLINKLSCKLFLI